MAYRVPRERFNQLVDSALESIPDEFTPLLDNVLVEVRDRPSPQWRRQFGVPGHERVYGFYAGVPLTQRGALEDVKYPDRIIIFQRELEDDFGGDERELQRQIRITVLHEVGHHFGLDEADMEFMEE